MNSCIIDGLLCGAAACYGVRCGVERWDDW
jgi:hypothetical protein